MMFEQHEDHRPVMWLGGRPLFVTHCIVLGYLITMIVATLLGPVGTVGLAMKGEFDSRLVAHGQVWRLFTYGLINPPGIGFLIDMVMLVWFGREVERFFGRRIFLWFYAGIYLLGPLLFTAFGFIQPTTLAGQPGSLAVFIAFATLYPSALLIFGIPAMWWAIGAVAINSLIQLYARQWVPLAEFLITVAFAFVFVRYQQGRIRLPAIPRPSLGRKPKLRVLPNPKPAHEEEDTPMGEVDALLDKIAKHGIASLTARERARLEKAREELMKRESPKR